MRQHYGRRAAIDHLQLGPSSRLRALMGHTRLNADFHAANWPLVRRIRSGVCVRPTSAGSSSNPPTDMNPVLARRTTKSVEVGPPSGLHKPLFRVRRGRVRSIERIMIANRASNRTVLGPKRDYLVSDARIPVQNWPLTGCRKSLSVSVGGDYYRNQLPVTGNQIKAPAPGYLASRSWHRMARSSPSRASEISRRAPGAKSGWCFKKSSVCVTVPGSTSNNG